MKIFKRLFAIAIAASLVVFLSGFSVGENNAAGINKDFGCWLYDGYGNLVVTYENIKVENYGGITNLICHAKDVPTPGVFRNAGFPCGFYGEVTYLSKIVISANGEATLKCIFKKPKK